MALLRVGHQVLETGIGGVKSPKIRGGVKILNFQGPLNLTLFYRDSIENHQFVGQKCQFSRGNFRGEFPPPPPSVRYVLTPPIPASESWEFAKGGAKRIVRFWGGGKRTIKHPLQNQFWRPQKVGFVWSVPVSSKEGDIA